MAIPPDRFNSEAGDQPWFADYKEGDKQFYHAWIPFPSLAYPLSLKQSMSDIPFIHLNVVDAVAAAPRTQYAIGLYMPASVRVAYNANWETLDLGFMTGEIANIVDDIARNKATFGDVISGLPGVFEGAQQQGFSRATDSFTGLNAGAAAEIKARRMVNPHAALRFVGMTFREFVLDFTFLPKNQREAQEIQDILFQIKYAMHPEGSTDIIGGQGAAGAGAAMSRYFLYPNNFIVSFYAPGLKFLFRTSACALLACNIEYNGAGVPAFFKSSHPVCIQMSLHFRENEILTKQRIREGW